MDAFQGDQNIGYYRLYANLKRNEDAVQELNIFVKERIGIEDELLKFLNKNLHRVSWMFRISTSDFIFRSIHLLPTKVHSVNFSDWFLQQSLVC